MLWLRSAAKSQKPTPKSQKPTMNNRQAQLFIFIGTNGTGKSTAMKAFLAANKRNLIMPANALDPAWASFPKIEPTSTFVLDPDDYRQKRKRREWKLSKMNTFSGTKVLNVNSLKKDADFKSLFSYITDTNKPYVNGGIFIDDFKNWIYTKGSLPIHVRRLFNDRRHRMIDIFMASHSFQDVNGDLIQFNPRLIVFKTTLPPNETVEKKITNYPQLLELIARVNQRAIKNPHYCEEFIPAGVE
jgi:hypothetical protein